MEQLDIGVSAFTLGPRHGYDLDVAVLPELLAALAREAGGRGQQVHIQLPGRCLLLGPDQVADRMADLSGRPRLRVIVSDESGFVENVAIELWRRSTRAYRSLGDDTDVRLSIPGAPPPHDGPAPTEDSIDVPIDVVYTWVNAADPEWRAHAAAHLDLDTLDGDLYVQTDELRYSLRSVETFAPWVQHVYVLSNCRPPAWFRATPWVTWVDHAEVAEEPILPLYNSAAIDTLLHRIPGLSEHFLYLNDDFMLWDSVRPATFFTWDDRSIARMATNSSVIYLQQLVEAGRAAPSQHSRVNAARLVRQRYEVFPTKLHGHVPYALRRSLLEEMEQEFSDEIAATRASRTRASSDISLIPYLYPHYAYLTGRAVYEDAPQSFVTLQNYERPAMRRALLQTPFACFQDSRGSAAKQAYQDFKRRTLATALPIPSQAEGRT